MQNRRRHEKKQFNEKRNHPKQIKGPTFFTPKKLQKKKNNDVVFDNTFAITFLRLSAPQQRLCLSLAIFMSLGYCAEALENTNPMALGSVDKFIAAQTVIRTYEDMTPNFGNLATTHSMMARTREMGFKGTFEFIYNDRCTKGTDDACRKVPIMFDLPKNIPIDYLDKETNIRFITFTEYGNQLNSNSVSSVEVSMVTGGWSIADTLSKIYKDNKWNFNISNNDANMLNSKASLTLTPWMEKGCSNPNDKNDMGESSEIYFKHQENPIKLCHSPEQFLVAPFANYKQAKSYLHNTTNGQRILKEKPALNSLLEIIENQSANMLFAYGNGIPNVNCYNKDIPTQNCESREDLQSMLGIISGVRHAQTQTQENLNKPVIIVVFKNYNETAKDLTNIIKNDAWDNYNFKGKENAEKMIKNQQLHTVFESVNIADIDAKKKLSNLRSGSVLLLTLGSLPKTVFDGLYTHTGSHIWPAIREGENAKNSLILNGKPHFLITDDETTWEPSSVGFGPDNFDKNNLLNKKYNNMVFVTSKFWTELQPTELISEYVTEAQTPASSLSKYFAWLKEQAVKPENDRILSAFEVVAEKLRASRKNL